MENKKKNKIISIDVGFSSIKVSWKDDFGSTHFERILNAVAKLPNPPESADDENIFQFLGEWYAIGPSALKLPRAYQVPCDNFDEMMNLYPLYISYLGKRYGGDKGISAFDCVAIGISLAFQDKADQLLDKIYDDLLFPPDRRDLFICLPQGVASRKIYEDRGLALRDSDSADKNAVKLKNYLIVDIGLRTCDICLSINQKSSVVGNVGLDETGTIRILYRIIDYIYQNFNGLKLTVKEALGILENGNLKKRGVVYNLQEVVDRFCKDYIKYILDMLEERFSDEVDRVEAILLLGGGANIFANYIEDPEVISEITQHFPITFLQFPERDSELFNAASFLLLAEKLMEE